MSEDFVHVDQMHELLASFDIDRKNTLRVVIGAVVNRADGSKIPPETPKDKIELSITLDEVERMVEMAFNSGIVSAASRKN